VELVEQSKPMESMVLIRRFQALLFLQSPQWAVVEVFTQATLLDVAVVQAVAEFALVEQVVAEL
jgi:hypothetical protein